LGSVPAFTSNSPTALFMRFQRSIALSLLVSFAAPQIAFAEGRKAKTVREDLSSAARAKWDSAVALFTRGKYASAKADFIAAYEISRDPRVLFNVAVCEKNLERFAAAVDTFKRELAEGAGKLSAAEVTEINNVVSGLERFVATVTVNVSEPGAKVFVDGEEVGISPLPAPIRVSSGDRLISARKTGFNEASRKITVTGGATSELSLKLESIVRTSLVNVNVVGAPSATVKVDDKEVGPAPFSGQVSISPDPHKFSAEAPGYVTAVQSSLVQEGQPLNITLSLSKDQEQGRLVISAKPEGATIEVDGKVVGATTFDGPVPAGSHQVTIKKQGYYTVTNDIAVGKGETRPFSLTLNEDRNVSFVPWVIGSIVVIGVGAVAAVFIFKPADQEKVVGTLPPGVVETRGFRF